jgi:hypothetical protein
VGGGEFNLIPFSFNIPSQSHVSQLISTGSIVGEEHFSFSILPPSGETRCACSGSVWVHREREPLRYGILWIRRRGRPTSAWFKVKGAVAKIASVGIRLSFGFEL